MTTTTKPYSTRLNGNEIWIDPMLNSKQVEVFQDLLPGFPIRQFVRGSGGYSIVEFKTNPKDSLTAVNRVLEGLYQFGAECCARFWASQLGSDLQDVGFNVPQELTKEKVEVSPIKIYQFQEVLQDLILAHRPISVGKDYDPDEVLEQALEATNLSSSLLPEKTVFRVFEQQYVLGYSGELQDFNPE